MDPRRSFLCRSQAASPLENNEPPTSGTTFVGGQPERLDVLNSKREELNLPPLDIRKDARYPGFILKEATKRGFYVPDTQMLKEEIDRQEGFDDNLHGHDSDVDDSEETESEEEYISSQEAQKVCTETKEIVKKVGGRGPTELKKFWAEYDPSRKINLQFNNLGQPCGIKTSKLTNFIGSLVKGKEISLAYRNWSKVPVPEKTKLWGTVKGFFNIDDSYKSWVLRSASKKWKDFKAVLKRKYFDTNLSREENIVKGCEGRIHPKQWVWLVRHWKTKKAKVMSNKNKHARETQLNGIHSAGSRSFAVVHDQMEIKEGRAVGRAELYVVTHKNKKGEPIDEYCAGKIDEIESKLKANPGLIGEKVHEADMYSTVFPKAKTSMMHGLGLTVGGKKSEQIAQLVAALHERTNENKELRSLVENLAASQSQLLEEHKEMRAMFLASQKHQPSQQEHENPDEVIPKDVNVDPVEAKGLRKSYEQLQAEDAMFQQVKIEMVEETNAEEKKRSYEQLQSEENTFKEVKIELAEPSNAEEKNLENKKPISRRTSKNNKTSQPKVPRNKVAKGDTIKCGMEVGLTSPNSAALVALATVQNIDKEAKCMDGKPLSDYVEVLVNVVIKGTTLLPRAQGRVLNMGNAQARSIPWPRENVTSSNGTPLLSKEPAKYRRKVATKIASSQPGIMVGGSQSHTTVEKTSKMKKKGSDATMSEATTILK